jgi:probable HAF family extracellular repeat protein
MLDLGTLGGSGASALAINSTGHVVGQASTAGDTSTHAFLWSKSRGIQDLGLLPGGDTSVAYGINAVGTVVGSAATIGPIGQHAFVWTKSTGMQDLNDLIPSGTGWLLVQAAGINKSGQIVGWGTQNNSPAQGFLLTPVGSSGGTTQPRR